MDPDNWRGIPTLLIVVLQEFQSVDCFVCELLVQFNVGLPVVRDEGGSVRHGVEQGPECAVAAAIVVAVEEVGLRADWDNLKRTSFFIDTREVHRFFFCLNI